MPAPRSSAASPSATGCRPTTSRQSWSSWPAPSAASAAACRFSSSRRSASLMIERPTHPQNRLGLVAHERTVRVVADVRAEGSHRLEQAVEDHRARAAVVANAAEDRVRDPAERRDLGDDPQPPVRRRIGAAAGTRSSPSARARRPSQSTADIAVKGSLIAGDSARRATSTSCRTLNSMSSSAVRTSPMMSVERRSAVTAVVHSLARPRHDQRVALHDEEARAGHQADAQVVP